ncbi:hypothetical protein LO80_04125 [Candidatus Francisella endociliophora]|uniref:Uncharacterized protein n=1 Tax=Candidatus Francisella endociliophora TaxID=653937 RepID=A0A097ENU8_9GAMM|nr:hypothetical protein [Francisella sp. FSC1006]AIT09241.1 hypothetical protein LO80_04125 [Francisella sp. FSC1006]
MKIIISIISMIIVVSSFAANNCVVNDNCPEDQLKSISSTNDHSNRIIIHSQTEYPLQNNTLTYNSNCVEADTSTFKYDYDDIYKIYNFKLKKNECGMFVSEPYLVSFKFSDNTGYSGISIDLDSGKYRIASNHLDSHIVDGQLGKTKTDFSAESRDGKTYVKHIVK